RRHIVMLLSHTGDRLPSGYLAKRFHHSWPTTTRHLGVLEKAGLVVVERRGRSTSYTLNRGGMECVVGGGLAKLEPPSPKRTWTSKGPKSVLALTKKGKS